MKAEMLRIHQLTKYYSNQKILDNFHMNLYEGEVMGLIGLHDSGKSTLFRIICGKEPYDDGSIYYNEERCNIQEIAGKNKIFLIQEKSALVETLSVLENIFIVRKKTNRQLFIRKNLLKRQLEEHFLQLDISIPYDCITGNLTEVEKRMVELAKGYILGAKIILIDISDIHLPYHNYTKFFELILRLKQLGVSFLISGYRLEDLQLYSDRILFLSNGYAVKTIPNIRRNQINVRDILLGNEMEKSTTPVRAGNTGHYSEEVVLDVRNITTDILDDISFQIHKGEIVVILDLFKNTNNELFRVLSGNQKNYEGKILFEHKKYDINKSEKRKEVVFTDFLVKSRIVPSLNLRDNICLPVLYKFGKFGFVNVIRMKYAEKEFILWYGKYARLADKKSAHFNELEKMGVYLYQLKLQKSKLLVCSNPEKISDYMTYKMIQDELLAMALEGKAICIFATNIGELYNLADRFVLLSEGRVEGSYSYQEMKEYFGI